LPLGFSRDPRRVTDGNLDESSWVWSPDASEILLTTPTGDFLLDSSKFTPQSQRVNISSTRSQILSKWEEKRKEKVDAKVRSLPIELQDILNRKSSQIQFSPDQEMVLYTASSSGILPDDLARKLPGASTQRQERDIKVGRTYIYDIEEDRNFLIDEGEVGFTGIVNNYTRVAKPSSWRLEVGETKRSVAWYASSRHLILSEDSKITILDYDGTNRQVVYSGSYVAPSTLPTLSLDRILILTNLGGNSNLPNLYSLSIK
jgi:hypothetical protein